MTSPSMFLRFAPALLLATVGSGFVVSCGGRTPGPRADFASPAELHRVGPLAYVIAHPRATERKMSLWVRVGAYDGVSPQAATALAWSFETPERKASVFPFATRFDWACSESATFAQCAEIGLQVFHAPPPQGTGAGLEARFEAGRQARLSENPDVRDATVELLASVFDEHERLYPLASPDSDTAAVSHTVLQALWDAHYGANNALLVSEGFEVGAQHELETAARALRTASTRLEIPAFALAEGDVRFSESSPGYGWTAAVSSCFEILARLRQAATKLQPSLRQYLIDVRGHAFMLVLVGPPGDDALRDLLQTVVAGSTCRSEDPVMRWLIGKTALDTTR